MAVWRKRIGYTAVFLVWAMIMLLPIAACTLLFQGQLVWGEEDPNNQIRIFLLQEVGQEGIGLQWSSVVDEEAMCVDTTVRYLMIEGEGANADFCRCMSPSTADDNLPSGCIGPEE